MNNNNSHQSLAKIGKEYTYDEMRNIFHCSNTGGIRQGHLNKKIQDLVLVYNFNTSCYEDKRCGNLIWYSGTGREGNETFDKKKSRNGVPNSKLRDSTKNNIKCFLFYSEGNKKYIYDGQVRLSNNIKYKWIKHIDVNKDMRKIIQFPLVYYNKYDKRYSKKLNKLHKSNFKHAREMFRKHNKSKSNKHRTNK